MNILEKITERTKERIEEEKKIVPLEEVQRQAEEKGIKDQIPVFMPTDSKYNLTTSNTFSISFISQP